MISVARKNRPLSIKAFSLESNRLRALTLLIGGGFSILQLVVSCFGSNPDGTSYLDLSSKILDGDIQGAVNGYWNPLYPALLAGTLFFFGEKSYWEAPGAHLLSFFLLVLLFFCYRSFLRTLLAAYWQNKSAEWTLNAETIETAGYAVFFWCTLQLTPILKLTPDLLVMIAMVVSSQLLFLSWQRPAPVKEAMALGATLAFGYWAKAIMFPYALVVLGTYFLLIFIRPSHWRGALAAVFLFAIMSSPLLLALSNKYGRPTYSESGRLAYIWMVNEVTKWFHWQGKEPGSGTPVHPTTQILDDPPVFTFERQNGGTFPPWLDPVHYNAGIQLQFQPVAQVRAILEGIEKMGITLGFPLFIAALVLFGSCRFRGQLQPQSRQDLLLLLPTMALAAMYLLVYFEPRYLAAGYLVVTSLLLVWSRLPTVQSLEEAKRKSSAHELFLRGAIVLSLGALFGGQLVLLTFTAKDFGFPRHAHWQTAQTLKQHGIGNGGRIGVIGSAMEAYYARLGGWQVIAETPGLGHSGQEVAKALEAMFGAGVDVVVVDRRQPLPPGLEAIRLPLGNSAILQRDYHPMKLDLGWKGHRSGRRPSTRY